MAIVKRKISDLAEQVIEAPGIRRKIFKRKKPILLVPTGSTTLNLICSGNPFGGFATGTMVNLIGDSSSGKSLLTLTLLAEICERKEFDDYQLLYNDAESALKFDIKTMFGKKLEKRIEVLNLRSAENFYGDILRRFKKTDAKFIYIVDSWDAMRSLEEEKRAVDFAGNKEIKGTFGTSKQKLASEIFRVICGELEDTDCLLIIISQTRMNLKSGLFGKATVRSGGYALKFYATHEIWMSILKHHKESNRTIGINTLVKVEKNKLTGREDTTVFPIYYQYGVDDITSCIDFLIEEKFWKRVSSKGESSDTGKKIKTDNIIGIKEPMSRSNLIDYIEKNNLQHKLQLSLYSAWKQIDEELKIKRKKKYE